jgi:chemotaxis protein methyltransferase CheR
VHLRALACIEAGLHDDAARWLDALRRGAPDYLPAVLEEALLYVRLGDDARATRGMHEVIARTEGRDASDAVQGPETLTVAYYRNAANAFFASRTKRQGGEP